MNYNSLSIDDPNTPLFYNDDTKRYIKMEYRARHTDWNMTTGAVESSSKYAEAQKCQQENFEVTYHKEVAIEYFKAWDGYSIVCAPMQFLKDSNLLGTTQSDKSD